MIKWTLSSSESVCGSPVTGTGEKKGHSIKTTARGGEGCSGVEPKLPRALPWGSSGTSYPFLPPQSPALGPACPGQVPNLWKAWS